MITNSPAFRKDGVLVITFDESDSPTSDASACCGQGPGTNSPLPGITGLGGGRVGALVISPFVKGGTWSTTPYNHYSLWPASKTCSACPTSDTPPRRV
jgi:hypothetical protein